MQFVDTNIVLRYLTQDDPEKAERCRHLFEQAQKGEIELTTSESVIAEVVYVLSSKQLYGVSRPDIHDRLYAILSLQGLKLSYKRTYFRALKLYRNHSIDFEDAMTVAFMERQGIEELYSYDRDFDKIETVSRTEP